MSDADYRTEPAVERSEIDVGRPVEWIIDPERKGTILGVTYVFSKTGRRKTVWYTPNKRRPKVFAIVFDLDGQ